MSLPTPFRFPAPSPTDTATQWAFPATSRYYGIPTASYGGDDGGTSIVYLTRRFCPPADALPLLTLARVSPGERLDQLTARTLGDPTQFWRVADANHAMNPFDLAAPGRVLRVPVPRHTPQP